MNSLTVDSYQNMKWPDLDQYSFLKIFNDEFLGQIKLYKHKQRKEFIFSLEKRFNQQDHALEEINNFYRRQVLNHPFLLQSLGFVSEQHRQFCSTTYTVQTFYQLPKSNLQKMITFYSQGVQFPTKTLLKMSVQILLVLDHLHSKSLSHGNIKPGYIGVKSNDDFLLIDDLIHLEQLDNLHLMNIKLREPLYLSPELFHKLIMNSKEEYYGSIQNDLFALGLCILQTGLGSSV